MTTNDVPNVHVVVVDPTADGFYKSRTLQWASMCPHINPTEYRVLTLLVNLCSDDNYYRKITLADIAQLLPSGKTNPDGTFKAASLSTVASCINALAAVNQVTDPDGRSLRVSNKTKGDLRLAPWRILRHECTASRNVHDALARIRGVEGERGPRYPVGLGPLAQNSVPGGPAAQNSVPKTDPAQNSVPSAQDSVPPAQNLVPASSKMPSTTSENRQTSKSTYSSSLSTPTHTTNAPDTDQPEPGPGPETSVCVTPEQMEKIIEAVRTNVIDRCAHSSKQKQVRDAIKKAIVTLARTCAEAGATVEEIDIALSGAIDNKTTHPYTHGTDALNALLTRKRGAPDPLGNPTAPRTTAANSWTNPATGIEWPHHSNVTDRACGGDSCADFKGQRYVAVEWRDIPDGFTVRKRLFAVGEAFSCPVCKAAYEKEATAV